MTPVTSAHTGDACLRELDLRQYATYGGSQICVGRETGRLIRTRRDLRRRCVRA
jgi:hypothetical protein